MKRSEMLDKIAKLLYVQARRLDDGNMLALADFKDCKEEWIADADEILTKIEENMIPPFNPNNGHFSAADADGYEWEIE